MSALLIQLIERSPAITIDADVYGNVTPDKIECIVEKYR